MRVTPVDHTRTHTNRVFVLRERGSEARFLNPHEYVVNEIHIDGGLINDHRLRCDYLVDVLDLDLSILIELKGSDTSHAVRQLESTYIAPEVDLYGAVYWLVWSGHSAIPSTQQQKEIDLARRRHGVRLRFCKSGSSWPLSDAV